MERKSAVQKSPQKKQTVQEVHKPILTGSWHGKDAYKLGKTIMLSILGITLLYLIVGLLFGVDSLWVRMLMAVLVVGLAMMYLYNMGMRSGEADAAFAEIQYEREREGKSIDKSDRARCFHPAKGFFAVLIGVLPYVLIATVFALIVKPAEYTLGVLPGWIQNLMRQREFGDALEYYAMRSGVQVMDIYRIVVRALVMPFINAAILAGDSATLWVERLSPLLLCIAPLGFGLGYRNGIRLRVRINTGILIADNKKKRKERKEKQRRQRSDSPERLI